MKELFGQPYSDSDPYWVVKGYFDRMYHDGNFIRSIELLVERWGFSVDGAYCNFPDLNGFFEEEHFEGVEFAYGYPPKNEGAVIVSEGVCSEYMRVACDKYVGLHPEDAAKVKGILSRLSF
ncbi:ribonuclease toxin immunity protein CdiI [Pseudomonas mosselii]|uniref:ribonuclease toxin immunity protein CdiI n=1 Tax=Pseudomonas mosselii TaxID=78327 RepID=UPI002616F3FD|nr:ribonuclease toxin immunity protein CdiI [Pseudomonas mosselii]MDN4499666.1 ribonuclease toxin immunity protein CdiI [Pseudomonas mosselii]